jgi:hypothetical protein
MTDSGCRMKLYAERQARTRGRKTGRWWLFSLEEAEQGREQEST